LVSVEHFEVEDCSVPAGVEEVLAQHAIASEAACFWRDAQSGVRWRRARVASAARAEVGELAQAPLERLVGGDGERAAVADGSGSTDDTKRASCTRLWIESRDLTERNR